MIRRRSLFLAALLAGVAAVVMFASFGTADRAITRAEKQPASASSGEVNVGRPAASIARSVPRFTNDASEATQEHPSATRAVRPQRDLTAALQPRPPWPGPWPESVDDLKDQMTPALEARIEEYGGRSSVDQTLKFLSGMRRCLESHTIGRPGGVLLELPFTFDHAEGTARGGDVGIEQSGLDPGDDLAVLDCAGRIHTGIARKMGKAARESTADSSGYVWRMTLNVPVENDGFFPWLLGK
jgi:hypothetical protein